MKTIRCCICGEIINEMESHNPWPVRAYSSIGEKENRCCQDCNDIIVLPARIACVGATKEDMEKIHERLQELNHYQLVTMMRKL